jgi:hypothetical protein
MIEDFEQTFGSFFRFLHEESTEPCSLQTESILQSQPDWREVEHWAHSHFDPNIRTLSEIAFDRHDQDAMNQLRLEYAWMLQRRE